LYSIFIGDTVLLCAVTDREVSATRMILLYFGLEGVPGPRLLTCYCFC